MNHQTIKMLSHSLKQIEKHCQKIKREIKDSMKKSRLKDEMSPSEVILKDNLGNDISANDILNEFNIIEYPKRKASFESLIQDFSISLKENKIENKIPDFIKLITEQRNIQSSKNIQALIPFDLNIY